ncbi:MAG: hypothetical protein A2Y90_03035 [Chloroflexi bacterium RBG_13_52_12]|nr:MAG: hypothetical protein A2Y90_03035 [Chloroflexi bacterium RBG_13_52_12]
MVIGPIILAVGIILLLVKLDVLDGSVWDYAWPAVLVIIGLSFILGRFRRRRWWSFWGPPPWDDRDKPGKE